MVLKTLKNQFGVTLSELVLTVGIITILLISIMLVLNPIEMQERGRDEKRMSDLAMLDRAISEYILDNDAYPDSVDTTRYSDVLPTGNGGPLQDPTDGWLDQNMVNYMVKLPTDPINDNTYRYSYRHGTSTYELNAVLEYYSEYMEDDGGNSNTIYEIGNDLTIL